MAQLDFGLLNTNLPAEIAGSVQRGQDEALRNQMAQQQLASNQQQFRTAGLQQESAQMQLEQAKRDRDSLAKMQEAFVANGKSPDLETNFDEMIKSGIAHYVDIGIKGKQKLMEQKQFANIMGAAAPAAPMPTATPPIAYPQTAAQTNALGSGAFGMEPVAAPMNALVPSAPTAPMNALAAPAAGPDVTELRRKRNMLLAMGTTQSIAAAKAMDADIALAVKDLSAPDAKLMQQLGYPLTQAGYQAFQDAKRQDRLLTPAELQQKLAIAAAGRAPGTNVTMVAEKAEAGAFGKMMVDQFADLSKSANLAVKTLPSIEANLNILNKGLDTGFGTETKAAGARVLSALGVKDAEKYATDTQTFQSNAIQGLMQKQLEQKGPQTESDAQRLEQIGAQLGKTKKANEFILDTAKEQLKRDIEQRNFYAKWKEKTDSFKGAEDAWFNGEGSKSLFDRPALKKYLTPTTANAAPAASNRPSLESIFKK
jgi:hypothetical protein